MVDLVFRMKRDKGNSGTRPLKKQLVERRLEEVERFLELVIYDS